MFFTISRRFRFSASRKLMSLNMSKLIMDNFTVQVKITVNSTKVFQNKEAYMIFNMQNLNSFDNWLNENFNNAIILNQLDDQYQEFRKIENLKLRCLPAGDPSLENLAAFFCLIISDICKKNGLGNEWFKVAVEVIDSEENAGGFEQEFNVKEIG